MHLSTPGDWNALEGQFVAAHFMLMTREMAMAQILAVIAITLKVVPAMPMMLAWFLGKDRPVNGLLLATRFVESSRPPS